jgi:hypothetical protein
MRDASAHPSNTIDALKSSCTGSERLTDTFQHKHHAIPVSKITATDRILDATCRLTTVIEGIQEAAPDKLQAIESLC